ncbi:hypothetical protein YC2023_088806 [Brassica napus]
MKYFSNAAPRGGSLVVLWRLGSGAARREKWLLGCEERETRMEREKGEEKKLHLTAMFFSHTLEICMGFLWILMDKKRNGGSLFIRKKVKA